MIIATKIEPLKFNDKTSQTLSQLSLVVGTLQFTLATTNTHTYIHTDRQTDRQTYTTSLNTLHEITEIRCNISIDIKLHYNYTNHLHDMKFLSLKLNIRIFTK